MEHESPEDIELERELKAAYARMKEGLDPDGPPVNEEWVIGFVDRRLHPELEEMILEFTLQYQTWHEACERLMLAIPTDIGPDVDEELLHRYFAGELPRHEESMVRRNGRLYRNWYNAMSVIDEPSG